MKKNWIHVAFFLFAGCLLGKESVAAGQSTKIGINPMDSVIQVGQDSMMKIQTDAKLFDLNKETIRVKKIESAFDDEKTPVHPQDLPNSIKETLQGEEFRSWKTAQVSWVKPVNKKPYYEIALLKDDQVRIAKFKDNGKVL